jgi:signal peptidase II
VRPERLSLRLGVVGLVAALIVTIDLLTKRWAATTLAGAPRTIIDPVLTFTFTENAGASFSLFQGFGSIIGVAAFVAVGIVIASVWHPRPLGEIIAFGMVAAGAIGNLIDRIARGDGLLDGKVIDWIQFPNFPVFNIADSSITVGVALLLLLSWRHS